MSERNISYEILEHIGVISRYESGWNKELNLISWNGGVAKYDIRDWDHHHERMGRGLTLHSDEMRRLIDLYLTNNSQKAIERGRAVEEERRERRAEHRREYQEKSGQNTGQERQEDAEDIPQAADTDFDRAEELSGEEISCAAADNGDCLQEEHLPF